MFSALHKSIKSKPSIGELQANVLAGLTVGVIALPLSMGLAIASGAPPQHGLYTAIIAGIVIALSGGSRVNISGPTAAFVVILLPVVQQYGLGGLLFAGFLSGIILIAMGLAKLGGLIQMVPYPITVGFTAGIGVVIAVLQLKTFLGLDIDSLDGHFIEKVITIVQSLPTLDWRETTIGVMTFSVLVFWGRLKTVIPSHLVALFVGAILAWLAGFVIDDFDVATIGSTFHYDLDGVSGKGIPPFLPEFAWPWQLSGKEGQTLGFSLQLVRDLLGPAFAIAILCALESLLCAVVADSMSGGKHNPDDELIGQGLGNMIVPLFGGIPATAAIARTAANVRAGGTLPLSSVVHALFILLAILVLAPLLAFIPMASIAALLLMVAWNMSEAKHFVRIVKVAPVGDVATLLTCFSLTVLLDMEIAVAVGMSLAGVLFIRRSIELTGVKVIAVDEHPHPMASELPPSVIVYDINGAMFFGSAQKALTVLSEIHEDISVVILDMSAVTMLDMTGMVAMESIVEDFKRRGIRLIINNLEARMILKLRKVGVRKMKGIVEYCRTMDAAIESAKREDS